MTSAPDRHRAMTVPRTVLARMPKVEMCRCDDFNVGDCAQFARVQP